MSETIKRTAAERLESVFGDALLYEIQEVIHMTPEELESALSCALLHPWTEEDPDISTTWRRRQAIKDRAGEGIDALIDRLAEEKSIILWRGDHDRSSTWDLIHTAHIDLQMQTAFHGKGSQRDIFRVAERDYLIRAIEQLERLI